MTFASGKGKRKWVRVTVLTLPLLAGYRNPAYSLDRKMEIASAQRTGLAMTVASIQRQAKVDQGDGGSTDLIIPR